MGVTSAVIKRAGVIAAGPVVEELSARFANITRGSIDTVVRTRAVAIAADVDVFRLQRRNLAGAPLERAFIRARARRGGATGFVSGLPSVVVGPGTVVEVAAAFADAAAVTYNEVSLILAIAYMRGRDLTDVESRRLDVLLTLGLQAGVVVLKDGEFRSEGQSLDPHGLDDLPEDVVGAINRELADRVVMKFARHHAAVLAGRLMPLGIGATMAGVEDFRSVGSVGRAARKFYDAVDGAPVR